MEVADANKTPVTIVTGFLGAGKTTLVNYILRGEHGKTIAVIENEFGEVSIDEALVAENMQFKEDVIELSNGCASGDVCAALPAVTAALLSSVRCCSRAVRRGCVLICGAPCRPCPQMCLLQHPRRFDQCAQGACGAGQALRPRPDRDDGPGGPSTCRAGACRAVAQRESWDALCQHCVGGAARAHGCRTRAAAALERTCARTEHSGVAHTDAMTSVLAAALRRDDVSSRRRTSNLRGAHARTPDIFRQHRGVRPVSHRQHPLPGGRETYPATLAGALHLPMAPSCVWAGSCMAGSRFATPTVPCARLLSDRHPLQVTVS